MPDIGKTADCMTVHDTVAELLDSEARRINSPEFIEADPVQFPRRFGSLPDIEITALLSATIAWGNRRMICRNCEKMLGLMNHEPYNYVRDCGYEDISGRFNIHRTFFSDDFCHFLRGLNRIYSRFGSIDEFAARHKVGEREFPAWSLAELLSREFAEANSGQKNSRCLPTNLEKTALKRINMALRWLVRRDGIVDMGVWKSISPSRLFIPLDVHVGNTARALGLLNRKSDDKQAAVQLTGQLRKIRPDDPTLYDFALFGIGIGNKYTGNGTFLPVP